MDIDIKKIIVSDAFAYGKSEKKKKKTEKNNRCRILHTM